MPEILAIFLYIILRAAIYGIVALAAVSYALTMVARVPRLLRRARHAIR